MRNGLRKTALNGVNTLLGLADLKLIRAKEHDWRDPRTYIPFEETIKAAEQAGMSVGQYIDATYNLPGSSEATIKQLTALGVLHDGITRVLELGPGSGRYLEQVQAICRSEHYEVYETAAPWANRLTQTYGVTLRPTNGRSLDSTPTASVDLAHAHKVMGVLPFLTICHYLLELMRVTREGGYVVFDVPTEPCMSVDTVQTWVDSDIDGGPYPSFIARQLVLDNFAERGFELVDTFRMPMMPGETEYFVFRRTGVAVPPPTS